VRLITNVLSPIL